jgi:hypothetical protein
MLTWHLCLQKKLPESTQIIADGEMIFDVIRDFIKIPNKNY